MRENNESQLSIWEEIVAFHENAGMAIIMWLGIVGWLFTLPKILDMGFYDGINASMAMMTSFIEDSFILILLVGFPVSIGMFIYVPVMAILLALKIVGVRLN